MRLRRRPTPAFRGRVQRKRGRIGSEWRSKATKVTPLKRNAATAGTTSIRSVRPTVAPHIIKSSLRARSAGTISPQSLVTRKRMNVLSRRAGVLTAALLIAPIVASAAQAKPVPMPTPNFPHKSLHVQLLVEVNKHGQVVRIDHGTLSGDKAFDTMTLGNAMQMWIRHPDGTAQTGLYRVTYDYNPGTHDVARVPFLVRPGGSWANQPGAALLIIQDARRQVQQAEARLRAEQAKRQQQNEKNLPDINAAVKRSLTSPHPSPHP